MITSFALALALFQQSEAPKPDPVDLETMVRQVEKEIAEIRGLQFKEPVKAKIVPRRKEMGEGIRGFYSQQSKSIELFDDIGEEYKLPTLQHEMVHALDDQNFRLSRIQGLAFTPDAQMAAKTLIEGSASYVMVLLDKGKSHVSKMMETQLDKARNLENAFVYGQGARYIKALHEKGGWEAVNNAFRNPPKTTAQILHPGLVLDPVNLGVGESLGEYEIIARFLANEETRPLALQAAEGWRGDIATGDKKAKSWTVLFATNKDALEFQTAMAKLRASKGSLFSAYEEAGVNVWHTEKNGVVAAMVRGNRAYVLEAASAGEFTALLDRLDGAASSLMIWSTADKKPITFGEFVDRLLKADIILVGETHDNVAHHRVQLQVIKALFAADESLGVGMEMFARPFQKEIDRYFAGQCSEQEFLQASQYPQRWGFPWPLYRGIVEFCRRNGIPLAALNAVSELTDRVKQVGYDNLTREEKEQLGEVDFAVPDHRAHWMEELGKIHGMVRNDQTPEQKERSYQVMTIWDEYMGASAANFQESRFLRRMVVLAGTGHVDYGWGIAARAAKRSGAKTATVHIEMGSIPMKGGSRPLADFVVIVK